MNPGHSGKSELSRRGLFVVGGLAAAACTAGPTEQRGLREAVRGRVLLPGDAGFGQARTPWNLTVDQPVRAVVELADAADAVALVRYARDSGAVLAVQPNGHNPSRAVAGTILVRTTRLNELRIDPGARFARVGAGVRWGQVQAAAGAHGLTGVAGSSPAVGVTGYTLGGGLSWFARSFGWAADSVTAFDIVDAGGEIRRVTRTSEPDLFWALRGGGGDYALVTGIEFELHPAPLLYGGKMIWLADRAPEVLAAFREITATAPDELTLWCSLLHFDGAPPMVGVDTTFLGAESQAQALLRPLDRIDGRIRDTRALMPIADLGTITGEPTEPSPVHTHVELLSGLPDVEVLLADPMPPVAAVQIRHLGGALARPSDSPPGAVTEPYSAGFIAPQLAPGDGARNAARIQRYLDSISEFRSTRTPFSLLSPSQSAKEAFSPDAHARLCDIKTRRDPKGLFRSNFPVLGPTGS